MQSFKNAILQNSRCINVHAIWSVWPDWVIYCTLGNFSRPVATIFYPNCPHIKVIFVKVSKWFIILVKSFLGNFYRHLGTFYWSHWQGQISSRFNCTCIIHEFWLKTRNHSSVLICNIILSTTKKSTAAQISQKKLKYFCTQEMRVTHSLWWANDERTAQSENNFFVWMK